MTSIAARNSMATAITTALITTAAVLPAARHIPSTTPNIAEIISAISMNTSATMSDTPSILP